MNKFPIERVILRTVRLPATETFVTSGWASNGKTPIIVEVHGQGLVGYGECAVSQGPFYNHEFPGSALQVLREFALPLFWKAKPETPEHLATALKKIVGNPFARSGLEMAFWDWHAKRLNQPLYALLGGSRTQVPVGVSIGIQASPSELLDQVQSYRAQGYQRIKIKIGPGKDLTFIDSVMDRYPDTPLMVDANSAYRWKDLPTLQAIDRHALLMIEQPFRDGDFLYHSRLQTLLKNSVCLDESITCLEDAESALAFKACRIINVKPGRVGGLSEAVAIHNLCAAEGIPVWCGGMLETGIGRAANMALATLPNFKFPGDISESKRYYHDDIVQPEIRLLPGGVLQLEEKPGIGFSVDVKALERFTLHQENHSAIL